MNQSKSIIFMSGVGDFEGIVLSLTALDGGGDATGAIEMVGLEVVVIP